MEFEKEIIEAKREWILTKLVETNVRRKSSLKEVADYIASKEISKKIEEGIRNLEQLKQKP
jgi:hypothetical protein